MDKLTIKTVNKQKITIGTNPISLATVVFNISGLYLIPQLRKITAKTFMTIGHKMDENRDCEAWTSLTRSTKISMITGKKLASKAIHGKNLERRVASVATTLQNEK